MKLSIIIPYYNTPKYTEELLAVLAPQITAGVEVLVVDDGSDEKFKTDHKKVKVIHQKNGGTSAARNTGIEHTTGEYISFIDSDDLVSDKFVATVLDRIGDADVIDLSWKTLAGKSYQVDNKLHHRDDRLTNPSVCTRIFKRSAIGDIRFNTKKDSTEDEDFCRKMGYLDPESKLKRDSITEYMYFYRTYSETSKSKKYALGLMKTKRVIYFYNKVTPGMFWLLDEIKKEDETNEVFLMTRQNEIKELARYCQVIKPSQAWAHILRGEPTDLVKIRKPAVKTQVVIYRRFMPKIGGLGTFIDNFIELMADRYDITIAADTINEERYLKWIRKVRVVADKCKNVNRSPMIRDLPEPPETTKEIYCDTLILLSFLDTVPPNVHFNKLVRMVHACKTSPDWTIPKDGDETIYVSRTAMESHGVKDGKVIHNLNVTPKDRALVLVSATRLPAPDKGAIEPRMYWLANELNRKGVDFIWLNFADGELPNPPKNFYNMGITDNIQSILKSADYLVQLSDSECWSYSCLEALTNGCAVICTPFPSAYEMGIKDGVNGYIVPFDLSFDVTRLKDVPKFKYEYDTAAICSEWVGILGDKPPRHDYRPSKRVMTKVKRNYYDVALQKNVNAGEFYDMAYDRAFELAGKGFVTIEGEIDGEI